MKPSARRRIERQITELMKRDGDRCSICKAPLPHNSRTFGGVTSGGDAALAGECCGEKLKETVLSGLYVDQRYKDMPWRAEPGQRVNSPSEVTQAIDAMQHSFRRIDQAADAIKAKGGMATKKPRINTTGSAWKADDALWFETHQARAHRLRPAFPGELEGMSPSEFLPAGHEYQVLVRQVEPGTRLRMVFGRNLEVPIPDVEPLIHAMFDMVADSEGGVLNTKQVAELALKYAAAGEGGKPQN